MNAVITVCIVSWVYSCVSAHEMNVIKGYMEFVFSLKQILFAAFFLLHSLFPNFQLFLLMHAYSVDQWTLNIYTDISFRKKIENKKNDTVSKS